MFDPGNAFQFEDQRRPAECWPSQAEFGAVGFA